MNTKTALPVFVCMLFALGGCSSDRSRPTQDNLQPTLVSSQIVVEEELVINTFKGGSNGLISGVYVPVAESLEGVFYDGPKDCVWELMNAERKTYEGGVWWPKSLNAKPRMYWRLSEKQLPEKRYDGTTIGGPIVYWIIQSGLGNANFFPEISDERIRKVISPREPVSKVGKH